MQLVYAVNQKLPVGMYCIMYMISIYFLSDCKVSYFLVDLTVVKEESMSGQVGNLMKKETRDEKVLPTAE